MTTTHTEVLLDDVSPETVYAESLRQHARVAVARHLEGNNWMERGLAAILLIPALPLIGVLIVLIRCTSPGPGIFRQERVGRNGRTYTMYKLRSMNCSAEAKTGPVWSTPGDPRTTPIGAFLRKAHLDELPQLVNVLRGDMRLVGPRPERPEFVRVLEDEIPGYCARLRVLPGITGLAQVNLPPDSGIDSVRQKLRLDVEYIQTAGIRLDAQILLCTAMKLFCVPSHIRMRITGVDRSRTLQKPESSDCLVALTPEQLGQRQNRSRHTSKSMRARPR